MHGSERIGRGYTRRRSNFGSGTARSADKKEVEEVSGSLSAI